MVFNAGTETRCADIVQTDMRGCVRRKLIPRIRRGYVTHMLESSSLRPRPTWKSFFCLPPTKKKKKMRGKSHFTATKREIDHISVELATVFGLSNT